MNVEYHGWIVLATSHDDWDDGDFEEGFDRVRRLLAAVPKERGNSVTMTDGSALPRMVYMSGHDLESTDEAIRLLKAVRQLFDRSYGELAVCDLATGSWDFSRARKITLIDGLVRE